VRQPVEVEATVLRAAQESLHNVRKHAEASAVRITLTYVESMMMLDVHDDGVGITDTGRSELSGGFGLESMRQRAAEHGGSVSIESDPGSGTTVAIAIPLCDTELVEFPPEEGK
jgi:signal transduction histidine kinase